MRCKVTKVTFLSLGSLGTIPNALGDYHIYLVPGISEKRRLSSLVIVVFSGLEGNSTKGVLYR
jgi:hypothetical protein